MESMLFFFDEEILGERSYIYLIQLRIDSHFMFSLCTIYTLASIILN